MKGNIHDMYCLQRMSLQRIEDSTET
jgi:hypothetical protein